jgi:hypothetical protein
VPPAGRDRHVAAGGGPDQRVASPASIGVELGEAPGQHAIGGKHAGKGVQRLAPAAPQRLVDRCKRVRFRQRHAGPAEARKLVEFRRRGAEGGADADRRHAGARGGQQEGGIFGNDEIGADGAEQPVPARDHAGNQGRIVEAEPGEDVAHRSGGRRARLHRVEQQPRGERRLPDFRLLAFR